MTITRLLYKSLFSFWLSLVMLSCAENNTVENSHSSLDTIPPILTLTGLVENQTIAESIQLNLQVSDDSEENVLLEIFLDNVLIYSSSTDFTFTLDPTLYSTGEKNIRFVVTDSSENSSFLDIDFSIQSVLLTLILEESYFQPPITETFAFISDNTGKVLDSVKIDGNETLQFVSPKNFNTSEDYILTLVTKNRNGSINLESIPHLNISRKSTFLLTNEGTSNGFVEFEVDVSSTDFFEFAGLGYSYFIFSLTENLVSLDLFNVPDPTEHVYFLARGDFVNSPHFYAKIGRDTISDPLVLTSNMFTSDHITVGDFPYSRYSQLGIFGFEDLSDFQNYKLHDVKFSLGQIVNQNRILHPYINNFPFYRHSYSTLYGPNLDGYRYLGEGLPLNDYIPIETNLSANTLEGKIGISLNSVENYYSGKIHLKSELQNSNWVINFDAENDRDFILPKLPKFDSLEELSIQDYEVKATRISRYSDIASFLEYLNKVRENNLQYYEHSSFVEHITVWPSPNFENRESFINPLY